MLINLTIDTTSLTIDKKEYVEALSQKELQQYVSNLINQSTNNDLIVGLLLDIREQVFNTTKIQYMPSTQQPTSINNNLTSINNNLTSVDNNPISINDTLTQTILSDVEVKQTTLNKQKVSGETSDIMKRILKMKGGKH